MKDMNPNSVIVDLGVFTLGARCMIYKEGQLTETTSLKITEAVDGLEAMCKEHNLNAIYLKGFKAFTSKIEKELKEGNLTQFTDNGIEIIIV